MRKLFFCLIAIIMVTFSAFANTIEIKKDKILTNTSTTTENKEKEDDELTICYAIGHSTSIHPSGVQVTNSSWWCVNHPEMPGKMTVYIGN